MNYKSKFFYIIKNIFKKNNVNNLSQKDVYFIFSSILKNNICDIELGSILIAMRIKKEKIYEILGFLKFIESYIKLIKLNTNKFSPIVIPAYGEVKNTFNFTPLLAILLARKNIPVLIHGITYSLNGVTTSDVLQILGYKHANSYKNAEFLLKKNKLVFLPINIILPQLFYLLFTKYFLGIRNLFHFLIKLIQPFLNSSLTLIPYTHPYYFKILSKIFIYKTSIKKHGILLIKSSEGEIFFNFKNINKINYFFLGKKNFLYNENNKIEINLDLPTNNDAKSTAMLIKEILIGKRDIPNFIKKQVQICTTLSKIIKSY